MKEMTYQTYATLILTNASVTDVPSDHHYYNMSAKRKHADISWAEDTIENLFERVLTSGCTTLEQALAFLKPLLLAHSSEHTTHKAATTFTRDEVTTLFQLSYEEDIRQNDDPSMHLWEIEKERNFVKLTADFPEVSPTISKLFICLSFKLLHITNQL